AVGVQRVSAEITGGYVLASGWKTRDPLANCHVLTDLVRLPVRTLGVGDPELRVVPSGQLKRSIAERLVPIRICLAGDLRGLVHANGGARARHAEIHRADPVLERGRLRVRGARADVQDAVVAAACCGNAEQLGEVDRDLGEGAADLRLAGQVGDS